MAKQKQTNSERHVLSKTSFIKGWQCQKQLYLYKNRYFLRDKLTPKQLAIFSRGHHVGKLAWQLFPNGIDASPKSPMQYEKALQQTQSLIQEGQKVIYEASFRYNKCLSILDILVQENGNYLAYEVKSSLSITDTYLMDAAFQYYVMAGAGFTPTRFSLIFVNKDYVFRPNFCANAYFIIQDITEKLIALQPTIEAQVELSKETILLPHSPNIDLGTHCETPYRCDFIGFCRKNLPRSNVFSLSDIPTETQYQLYQNRKIDLIEISKDDLDTPVAQSQLFAHKHDVFLIDLPPLEPFKKEATVAFWVWDAPAVPLFETHTPYTPILLGLFIKPLNCAVKPLFLGYKKGDSYLDFIKQINELIQHKDLISYDLCDYDTLFSETNRPIFLFEWVKAKRYYHFNIMGNYELTHVAKSTLSDTQFPSIKGTIKHIEALKNHLTSLFDSTDLISNDAVEFVENQMLLIEKLWNNIIDHTEYPRIDIGFD